MWYNIYRKEEVSLILNTKQEAGLREVIERYNNKIKPIFYSLVNNKQEEGLKEVVARYNAHELYSCIAGYA